jgi:D-alanyl-D-alanine carboxypeptidase (penicillin-binding protein 5/6)
LQGKKMPSWTANGESGCNDAQDEFECPTSDESWSPTSTCSDPWQTSNTVLPEVDEPTLPPLSCRAWHVMDVESRTVVTSSCAQGSCVGEPPRVADQQPLPLASLTKLMTAMVVLRKVDAGDASMKTTLSVSERAATARGTVATLELGDTLTIEQLLHALLLPSGNDAAIVLAEHLGGKPRDHCRRLEPGEAWPAPVGAESEQRIQRFLVEMTKVGHEWGLHTLFFSSPHGFHLAEGTISREVNTASCEDLCWMAMRCFADARIRTIAGKESYRAAYFRSSSSNRRSLSIKRKTWQNTGYVKGIDGWLAGKSGCSPDAGYNMGTLATIDGRLYVSVTIGSLTRQQRVTDNVELWHFAAARLRRA